MLHVSHFACRISLSRRLSLQMSDEPQLLNICPLKWPIARSSHCDCDTVRMVQSALSDVILCWLIVGLYVSGQRTDVHGGISRKAAAGELDKDGTPWVFVCYAGPARSLLWPTCHVSDCAFQ
jgi:hypothetical protein